MSDFDWKVKRQFSKEQAELIEKNVYESPLFSDVELSEDAVTRIAYAIQRELENA